MSLIKLFLFFNFPTEKAKLRVTTKGSPFYLNIILFFIFLLFITINVPSGTVITIMVKQSSIISTISSKNLNVLINI
jgi:hypothetical protein